ncbi:MAG: CPBP family intramembrane glutamic endopeptidase [Candidatus Sulfotelmatobacter sp.]
MAEVIIGYGFIVVILWAPTSQQRILSPIALVGTLAVVLLGRSSCDRGGDDARNHYPGAAELGLGVRGLIPSLWILPAACGLTFAWVLVAKKIGTLHPLYKGELKHVVGYVLWTDYQQFLLQDLFMPRLMRLLSSEALAITVAGILFATAHLPNLSLTVATLVWGIVSCALFLRYRNIYALGLAQGLLGLGFAICVPDAWHHHLRVGLGYLRYPEN